MSKVRVYNDNIYPHREKFKGEDLNIPPKGFIELDFFDAVELKGQYTPIIVDGGGAPLPQSFKMLRIVEPDGFKLEESKKIICNSCGQNFDSAKELDDHVTEFHIEQILDKDEREKRLKKAQK